MILLKHWSAVGKLIIRKPELNADAHDNIQALKACIVFFEIELSFLFNQSHLFFFIYLFIATTIAIDLTGINTFFGLAVCRSHLLYYCG